jgi:hypothetical protein
VGGSGAVGSASARLCVRWVTGAGPGGSACLAGVDSGSPGPRRKKGMGKRRDAGLNRGSLNKVQRGELFTPLSRPALALGSGLRPR